MVGNPSFSKLHHIGIVVRDMDKAIEYYKCLGIGPFKPLPEIVPNQAKLKERMIRGKPAPLTFTNISRWAEMGPYFIELLQPFEGIKTIWLDFLESKGEGIQHLAYQVDDIDAEEARLVKNGFSVLYRIRFEDGGGDTYFETDEVGGVLLSIVQF